MPASTELLAALQAAADAQYRDFHASLVPNEDKRRILGVRTPRLREIAKAVPKDERRDFLRDCGDDYYEQRILRAMVTGLIKPDDFEDLRCLADSFLPYVNSWAVCDCFCSSLKHIKKYREPFFAHIQTYLAGDCWAQRVALVLMLHYYLDDVYIDRVLARADSVCSEEYYVRMAQAWLVATALAKCPQQTLPFFAHNHLDDFTHNKAIQKACESYRVDAETKKYLRTLKRS
ncbi:MAG: DNA alkylation repair protein [Ruminococcus sp.]|nr:DNA alkylation repair protein [Ruminococcus sp.]